MRKWISAALIVSGLALVGCQSDDMEDDDDRMEDRRMSTTQPMSGDACSHCPGVQKATASGACPVCGMKPT